MAKKIDFYYMDLSPPCRAVMMTAKYLKIELNKVETNLLKGEHMTPQFLKMNPQHTIPTLNDNGFYLTESRPILAYLVNAYSRSDTLYPKDPKKRYVVDQRLAFDQGTLYSRLADLYIPLIFGGASWDKEKEKKLDEALAWFDGFLKKTAFAAGNDLTIADFTFAATLSQLEAFGHNLNAFPRIKQYMTKLQEEIIGYADLNQRGADEFGKFAKPFIQKAKA